jgi:hypothetical protein
MPFNSHHLQQICAKTVGSVSVSKSLKKAALNYNSRLGKLLSSDHKKVFESDLKTLAEFLQNSPSARAFSPNRYMRTYDLYKQLHKNMYALHKQEIAGKAEKATLKKHAIQQRLQASKETTTNSLNLRDQKNLREIKKSDDVVDLALKQRNIRQARKLSDRRARADELIDAVLSQPSKEGGVKSSSVHAELEKAPFDKSELVI